LYVNLRRPFNVSLYPFPELDPWVEQTGKSMVFKEIEFKKEKRIFGVFSSPKQKESKKRYIRKIRKIKKRKKKMGLKNNSAEFRESFCKTPQILIVDK